MVYKIRYLS